MFVHDFDQADPSDIEALGGKGAGLAEMSAMGLPVPPGFIITADVGHAVRAGHPLDPAVWDEVVAAMRRLEARLGRRFGAGNGEPLLVSVRSGAAVAMPGMMDTVLDVGVTPALLPALTDWAGSERFGWDVYRRFLQTYAEVVLGIEGDPFDDLLGVIRRTEGVTDDSHLGAGHLEAAAAGFQEHLAEAGLGIPADPYEQLRAVIEAVFRSWDRPRAVDFRRRHGIPDDMGTACTVQTMVFGDLGEASGTGVCFTRDPASGERTAYGDYLPRAQGEDVVAGAHNTMSLDTLRDRDPVVRAQLDDLIGTLEARYRDMFDIEFTVERGKLWVLQARPGDRTAAAALRIAVEMVDEGLITSEEALLRIDPGSLERVLHRTIDDRIGGFRAVAVGLNASPGAAVGSAVFSPVRAVALAEAGESVILVREHVVAEDLLAVSAARGVLTSHGGKTSHVAVVARGLGIPAVTGAAGIDIDEHNRRLISGDTVIREGDAITIDGSSGMVFADRLSLTDPEPSPVLHRLLEWADEVRSLRVRANADTARDARAARTWGAEGIGLARTEHMFLGDRLPLFRRVVLGEPDAGEALDQLTEIQTADFEAILEAMDGLPVVIRLLDPPLHEFLPDRSLLEADRVALEHEGGDTSEIDRLVAAVAALSERNPMLGTRGVRLGIVRPELYRAQIRAGATAVARRLAAGGDPRLEIMVPLVTTTGEVARIAGIVADEVAAAGLDRPMPVGAMIELPRAALRAGNIATEAEFLSFGTNDLTETTYGLSRDDAEGSFLPRYFTEGLLTWNPFEVIDRDGVGRLVEISVVEGRATRPGIEIGVCGEHGGDPESIQFFHEAGFDYLSCSPPRIPTARLAAARAALAAPRGAGPGELPYSPHA